MAQPDAAQESLIEPAYVLACMRRLLPTEEGGADSGVADDAAREEADADLIDAGCTVWDLAANVELAAFMCEHGLPVLLLRPIRAHESHSIRLVEVCVGALANLVGSEQLLRALTSSHPEAPEVLCGLLVSTTAAPVLLELTRLFSTALAILHTAPAGLSEWLLALSGQPSLGMLAHVVANTLRAELMERCATLLRALVFYDTAESRAARPADAAPTERVHTLLIRAELMPTLADLLMAHWRPRGDNHEAERLRALLALLDAMVCGMDSPLGQSLNAAGLPPDHAVWRTLSVLVQRADDLDHACAAACVVATCVSEGVGGHYLLDAPLLLALLRRVLPRCEEGLDGGGDPSVADDLADGARAAWAVVRASCARLDGLAISLDLDGRDSDECRPFWALMRAADALRRRVRWARARAGADTAAIAVEAADALLTAAGFVGTALGAPLSGCDAGGEGTPSEPEHADAGAAGGGDTEPERRQRAADRCDDDGAVLFRAMSALRSCFDDDSEEGFDEPLAPGRADESLDSDSADCGWEWEPQ